MKLLLIALSIALLILVSFYADGKLAEKDNEIIQAQTLTAVARDNQKKVQNQYEEAVAKAEEEATRAQARITSLEAKNRAKSARIHDLVSDNIQLEESLATSRFRAESSEPPEIAQEISERLFLLYPELEVEFTFEDDRFKGNRAFANAVLISLEEVDVGRIQIHNLKVINQINEESIVNLKEVIGQKDIQIGGWEDRHRALENVLNTEQLLTQALKDERDVWENKADAQSRKLFFYKWGTRIGLAGGAIIGIIAVTQ
jgi:uncharacterized protein YfcZ (UPF0381/DUF406 family)